MNLCEGNINFSEELMKQLCNDEKEDEKVCLITGEKLCNNFITLECGHTFNYNSIMSELINQRKKNRLEIQKCGTNQIKCPYCRSIHKGILPYIDGYDKLTTINWSKQNVKMFRTCKGILSSGKRKGEVCGCRAKFGDYCGRHKHLETN